MSESGMGLSVINGTVYNAAESLRSIECTPSLKSAALPRHTLKGAPPLFVLELSRWATRPTAVNIAPQQKPSHLQTSACAIVAKVVPDREAFVEVLGHEGTRFNQRLLCAWNNTFGASRKWRRFMR